MKFIIYKKRDKIIPANRKKHPTTIEDDIYLKLKELSLDTRTSITDLVDSMIRYALKNLEIKEED